MSRLSDAFERLITSRPAADPDDVLANARRTAGTARTRRRAFAGVGAAAAAIVAVVAIVALTGDDPADEVRTGPADTTTTTTEPSTPLAETVAVDVFFSPADDGGADCSAVSPVEREVAADAPIEGAIDQLLAGPPDGEGAAVAVVSFFSEVTAGKLNTVEVTEGVAFIDFENFASLINNASTSCGSANLLAQLDATATQFDTVDRAIYSFDGDAQAFYGWLQRDVPEGARPVPSPKAAPDAGYVTAGTNGVVRHDPDGITTTVTEEAALSAYGIGDVFVAYQAVQETAEAVFPEGPVMLWAGSEPFELPTDSEADLVRLLDAAPVDFRPTALVAERSGTGPTDTVEALVAIDLVTQERTVLVERDAWESVHRAARLLPDGDVVGLYDSEALTFLARWSASRGDAVWTNELGVDAADGLASGSGRISLVERPVWQPEGTAMGVVDIDLASGSLASPSQFMLPGQGEGGSGGGVPRCHDWWTSDVLTCSVSGNPPVLIGLDGTVEPIDAPVDARATPVR